MPIHTGQDSNGSFYQWGKTGKKYYYQSGNEESRKKALSKAKKQQTAIYSTGWKGDSMKIIRATCKDDMTDILKTGFPARFQLTFDVYQADISEKVKVIVQGKLMERSTKGYVEYKETSNWRLWGFKFISYRKIDNEWSYGRGAEKRGTYTGSPKNILKRLLEWQAVNNNWNDEVTNIKISFS